METDETTFKIEGDPGQHNTFIKIGTVQNYNPNATTVINNNYGTRVGRQSAADGPSYGANHGPTPADPRELSVLRNEILLYVSCLSAQVAVGWRSHYKKLWEGILDLTILHDKIYDPGKQQGTNFNRNLVANIIHYLGTAANPPDRVYPDYNAALFTEHLEGNKDHSVRGQLGQDPPPDICSRLDRFLSTFTL